MGVASELEVLQELHDKGKLTDAEFSTAKESVLGGSAKAKPKVRAGFIVALLVFSGLILWLYMHHPVQFPDQVENLPAHSYRAISFTTPYAGNLTVNIAVLHGNPIDVFVIGADQLGFVQALKWKEVRTYGNFNATKTQTYDRTGQLPQGMYYLILRDTFLGVLSASASDVSLKMRLNP